MTAKSKLAVENKRLNALIGQLNETLMGLQDANIWLNREVDAGKARLETLREDRDKLLISHKDLNNEYTEALELLMATRDALRKTTSDLIEAQEAREVLFQVQETLHQDSVDQREEKAQLLDEVRFWEDEHARQETIIDALIYQLKHKR